MYQLKLLIFEIYQKKHHHLSPMNICYYSIIEKSIFENYERGENLNPRDNYYFSKNVFEMFKKYPWKILINEFSNIKNNFEEDYQMNENPKYYKGYSLGDIAA